MTFNKKNEACENFELFQVLTLLMDQKYIHTSKVPGRCPWIQWMGNRNTFKKLLKIQNGIFEHRYFHPQKNCETATIQ